MRDPDLSHEQWQFEAKMDVHGELDHILRAVFARYAALEPSGAGFSLAPEDLASKGRTFVS